jgi:hypothetical protein
MTSGLWLWRRRPAGYLLGAVTNIKGATYTLALASASRFAARAGIAGAAAETPVWLGFTAAGLLACGLLLGNLRESNRR